MKEIRNLCTLHVLSQVIVTCLLKKDPQVLTYFALKKILPTAYYISHEMEKLYNSSRRL